VAYLKTFSRRFERGQPEPIRIGEPIPSSEESIQQGREIYTRVECNKCHGEQGRGDGPSAPTLETQEELRIWPADLTQPWRFKAGHEPADIYRTIRTGFTGTPMPSSEDILTEEETWHLVNFVRSLFDPPAQPEVKAAVQAQRVAGDLPVSPDDPAWNAIESFYFPLVGQIMDEPRHFTPMIPDIRVQAVYNDQAVALRLVWNDRTKSPISEDAEPLPDGVAVQFPAELTEGLEKPRFVGGDSGRPVNLWYWDSVSNTVQEQVARGVGTEQAQPVESQSVAGQSVYDNGQWRVVMTHPLTTGDENDIQLTAGQFIPIAFHAWDGSNGEAGGKHALSAWYFIFLAPENSPVRYAWVPVAILAAVAVEGGIVWWVRRNQ
jgi:DMSO reductase family type II enzyme heme b subunit